MNIVILEDEQPALELLVQTVRRCDPALSIAATFATVRDAVAWLRANPQPELILADIELADGLSLSVFERAPVTCPVVFCTAYDEYWAQAFRAGGIDYVLKPIEEERLREALGKYARLQRHFTGRLGELARSLATAGAPPPSYRQRVVAKKGAAFVAIAASDIAYFITEHRIVVLVDRRGGTYIVDCTLSQLEAELDPRRFFRVGRGTLISFASVVSFQPHFKGRLAVTVEPPGPEIIVSADRVKSFRGWMDR